MVQINSILLLKIWKLLGVKLGSLTQPSLSIRQKLSALENIRVWTNEKSTRVIRLESVEYLYFRRIWQILIESSQTICDI